MSMGSGLMTEREKELSIPGAFVGTLFAIHADVQASR